MEMNKARVHRDIESISKSPTPRFLVGIDEVGRGPIAGPLLLCAVALPETYDQKKLIGIKDSKKLSKEDREEWLAFAHYERKEGNLTWSLAWVSHKKIDERGMAWALRHAVKTTLAKLGVHPEETKVLLDGSLYAPEKYDQETIIKGDESVPAIALASNIAKVTRDARMERLAGQYPEYGFERHKGYGTKSHLEAVRIHGLSEVHRRSFLSRMLGVEPGLQI